MSATKANKLSAAEVSSVLQRCSLPPEAQELTAGQGDLMGIIQALTNAGFLVEATRAVSYTHLDVYKRQSGFRGGARHHPGYKSRARRRCGVRHRGPRLGADRAGWRHCHATRASGC